MKYTSKEIIEKFEKYLKIKEIPIAFFYTSQPPQEIYNPHPKNKEINPCIIQFLNTIKRGRTLVFSKKSTGLCRGGQSYLGFKKFPKGLEHFLSTGIPSNIPGKMLYEGERFKKSPKLAKEFYSDIPIINHSNEFAVFAPLDKVDLNKNRLDLVIFLVNMDQLGGLIQLFNYDTNNGTIIGRTSACGSIISEPMAEINRTPTPRAVIGLLSDMLSRRYITPDLASFTVPYNRLLQILPQIDESFLNLEAWQRILRRIK